MRESRGTQRRLIQYHPSKQPTLGPLHQELPILDYSWCEGYDNAQTWLKDTATNVSDLEWKPVPKPFHGAAVASDLRLVDSRLPERTAKRGFSLREEYEGREAVL